MWVVFIRTSFQYEGPDGNYSVIANSSAKLNNSGIPDFSVRPYPNNCACHDHLGKIYNLQPLQSTDGTARFAKHYCINGDCVLNVVAGKNVDSNTARIADLPYTCIYVSSTSFSPSF